MRILLRILAVLAAIAFVLAATTVVLFRPVGTLGLRAAVYKETLAGERIYERAPRLVGETMRVAAEAQQRSAREAAGGADPAPDVFFTMVRQLEPQDWETLIGSAVPTALLRAEVEKGLDEAERFIHGQTTSASAAVSLVEVKKRLEGGAVTEAYAAMLARKAPCTPEAWEASGGVPVACCPTPDKMAEALDTFGKITAAIAEKMPDSIDLLEGLKGLTGPEGGAGELARLRTAIRRTELIAAWSPAVPVVLALLIVLLAVRSARDLLLWWGVPCLIAGAISSLFALGTISVGIGMVHGVAKADLPPHTSVALVEAIIGTASAWIRAVVTPALWSGVALAAAGFAAVVLAFVIRPKAAPPPLSAA